MCHIEVLFSSLEQRYFSSALRSKGSFQILSGVAYFQLQWLLGDGSDLRRCPGNHEHCNFENWTGCTVLAQPSEQSLKKNFLIILEIYFILSKLLLDSKMGMTWKNMLLFIL